MVAQLVSIFPAFYGSPGFTRARYLSQMNPLRTPTHFTFDVGTISTKFRTTSRFANSLVARTCPHGSDTSVCVTLGLLRHESYQVSTSESLQSAQSRVRICARRLKVFHCFIRPLGKCRDITCNQAMTTSFIILSLDVIPCRHSNDNGQTSRQGKGRVISTLT
jgi:hypothetical protein